MGVSSSGKSTVAGLLASRLGVPFLDGDDVHSPENLRKMSSGIPLTDLDRAPWLDALASWIGEHEQRGCGGVVACSALKRAYRDRLRSAGRIWFLQLELAPDLAARRISGRTGHFMPPALLASQFDALEPLEPDEWGATVSAAGTVGEVMAAVESLLPRDPG
ncbi:gluconokinase [Kitasatospora sp. RB6PN24]|uniref:gluconokinase n=1 Tax=Kitasatospora humi TaxID=2893891 RepID=UPI001E3F47D4|nr:gluconokinase [Kitasatospora humi]MCC9306000.1 gluconokinase [Kitasatospora humi]